jgi:hypothetical protein
MRIITDEMIAAEQERLPGLGGLQAYRMIQARQYLQTHTARRAMTNAAGRGDQPGGDDTRRSNR